MTVRYIAQNVENEKRTWSECQVRRFCPAICNADTNSIVYLEGSAYKISSADLYQDALLFDQKIHQDKVD